MENGTVYKEYDGNNRIAPSLRQKVGRDCYYINAEDTTYSQNAREVADSSDLNWPTTRCNMCGQLGHMQARCMFQTSKVDYWLRTGSLNCCTRCGGMHEIRHCMAATPTPLSYQTSALLHIADRAAAPVNEIVEHARTHRNVIANMALAVQDTIGAGDGGTNSTSSEDMKLACPLLQAFDAVFPDDIDLSDGGMTIGVSSHEDLHNVTHSLLSRRKNSIHETVIALSLQETADPSQSILYNTYGTTPPMYTAPAVAHDRWQHHEPLQGKTDKSEIEIQIARAFELQQARESTASSSTGTTSEDRIVKKYMNKIR